MCAFWDGLVTWGAKSAVVGVRGEVGEAVVLVSVGTGGKGE